MFRSTRGNKEISPSLALINGIADDGGLYINEVKKVNISDFLTLDYRQMAKKVIASFLEDFKEEDILKCINNAYGKGFDTDELVCVKSFDEYSFLELYHGPTIAFKDMALTLLPHLLLEAKKINNRKEKTIILTATSGDTGAAALNGFKDVPNTEIIVFYPYMGVSDVQERQMLSYQGTNARVIAVKGNFDDCQSFVKRVFTDESIREKLKEKNACLSSANSINIGRLIPQIVYYFYTYIDLVKKGKIKMNDEINFCVPTGNFGNILAGYYAKKMGLPVNKLICASNKNKILTDFFHTGDYDINREFYKTNSPSMDILISSNLERLLFELVSNNPENVRRLMDDLKQKKSYHLDYYNDSFFSGFASEEETLKTIKECFEENNYLIDTHTAVSYHVYKEYLEQTNDKHHTVIVSTASPFKFAPSVSNALGLALDDEFNLINKMAELSHLNIPQQVKNLMDLKLNRIVWEKDEMDEKLKELLVIAND